MSAQNDATRFESVWDAIEGNPVHAGNLKLRSKLMQALTKFIACERLSQAIAAELMGVPEPRILDLARGRIDVFSIDTLVNMASAAGLKVDADVLAT